MFVDLAGNKKYLKTTLFGLTSQLPDYALIGTVSNVP
jgi:GTPase